MLNFRYIFFVGKHVANITLPTISPSDETSMGFDEEMLVVAPLFGHVRSYILKALIHVENDLQKIMALSIRRKITCERIIEMLVLVFWLSGHLL